MRPHRIHKVVLTGGPCSGKTTAQARLGKIFTELGWKVFRVPETATLLLQGGVEFDQMSEDEVESFQENLLLTLRRIEDTFFDLAKTCDKDCLIICDRGCMDPGAYMAKDAWERVLKRNSFKVKDLREDRYDQVLHLITAANGAEEHYNVIDNPCRMEGLELARLRDRATGDAWASHPRFEVIDNSTNFETKLKRVICAVCRCVGICLYDI